MELKTGQDQLDQEKIDRLFHNNYTLFKSESMRLVRSGSLARHFGQAYSYESLLRFANQMDQDVQGLVPGGYLDKERRLARLKHIDRLSGKEKIRLGCEISTFEPDIRVDSVREIFYTLVGYRFSRTLPLGTELHPRITHTSDLNADDHQNHFVFETRKGHDGKDVIEAKVSVATPELPVAQEEFLHAAQELCLGTVSGLKYVDPRIIDASKHVLHSSFILDRVLSAAATTMGRKEFAYWSRLADRQTSEFREKFLTNIFAPWERTPLGKKINSRFRYPIASVREIGSVVAAFSYEINQFLFLNGSKPNDDNQSLIEIISLQFGVDQLAFLYQLADLTDTTIKQDSDFERIGKSAIIWGRKILEHYKGRREERELVTHHSHIVGKINPDKYSHQATREMIKSVNELVDKQFSIPTTEINLQRMILTVFRSTLQKATEFTRLCFPGNGDRFVVPSSAILEKYRITNNDLKTIYKLAEKNHHKQVEYASRMHEMSLLTTKY